MKDYIFFFGLYIISMMSCGDVQKADNKNDYTGVGNTHEEKITYQAESFYKHYQGIIAGKEVDVYLQKYNGRFSGVYYYLSAGRSIDLMGMVTTADSLRLEEADKTAAYTSSFEPVYWECVFMKDSIQGSWIQKGKKAQTIQLHEIQEDNYFSLKVFKDTTKAFPGKESSPQAQSVYAILSPMGKEKNKQWLRIKIKEAIGIDSTLLPAPLADGIKKRTYHYFANYRQQVKELMPDHEQKEYPAYLNYALELITTIRYQGNGFLAMEMMNYEYSGGAHGNYGSRFVNFDIKEEKIIALKDIMEMDSVLFQKILEKQFREDYHIGNEKLSTVLFNDSLSTTENFYINQKGLSFLYNPYEIASYAQGQMEVFIPYPVLRAYLRQDFKERMNLK